MLLCVGGLVGGLCVCWFGLAGWLDDWRLVDGHCTSTYSTYLAGGGRRMFSAGRGTRGIVLRRCRGGPRHAPAR